MSNQRIRWCCIDRLSWHALPDKGFTETNHPAFVERRFSDPLVTARPEIRNWELESRNWKSESRNQKLRIGKTKTHLLHETRAPPIWASQNLDCVARLLAKRVETVISQQVNSGARPRTFEPFLCGKIQRVGRIGEGGQAGRVVTSLV